MPKLHDFHAFQSTTDAGTGDQGSGGLGCGRWAVIIVVVVVLLSMIADGASWDAIDSLLGWGLIAFFVVKSFF